MNLLDENIRQDQGELLRRWGIRFRWLTRDVARSGIQDPDVIPLLHRAHRVTFFTHDRDYFKRELLHPAYCLIWLDVFDGRAAEFIRRFLRLPAFSTHALRLGKVVRVHAHRITFWQLHGRALQTVAWNDRR